MKKLLRLKFLATAVLFLNGGTAHAVLPSEAIAAAGLVQPTYENILPYYLAGKTWLLDDPDFVREYGKISQCDTAQRLANMNQFQRQRAMAEAEGAARVALEAAVQVKPEPLRIGLAYFDNSSQKLGDYDFENEFFEFSIAGPGAMSQLRLTRDGNVPSACVPNHPELPNQLNLSVRGADMVQRLDVPIENAEALFNEVGNARIGTILAADIIGAPVARDVDALLTGALEPISRGVRERGNIGAIVTGMTLHRLELLPQRNRAPIYADFQQELLKFDTDYFASRYAAIRVQERAAQAALAAFQGPDGPVPRSDTPQSGRLVIYGDARVRYEVGADRSTRTHISGVEDIERALARTDMTLRDEFTAEDFAARIEDLPEVVQTLLGTSLPDTKALAMVVESEGEDLVYCRAEGGMLVGGGGASAVFGSGSSRSGRQADYRPATTVVERGTGVLNSQISGSFERSYVYALTEMYSPTQVRVCPYREALSAMGLVRLNQQGINVMAQDICRDFTVSNAAGWDRGVTQLMDFPVGSAVVRDVEVTCRRGGPNAPADAAGRSAMLDHILVSVSATRLPSSIHDPEIPPQAFFTLPLSAGDGLPWVAQ